MAGSTGSGVGVTGALLALVDRVSGLVESGQWFDPLIDPPVPQIVPFQVASSVLPEPIGPVLPSAYRRALSRFCHGPSA